MCEWARYTLSFPEGARFPAHIPRNGEEAHQWAAKIADQYKDDPRCRIPRFLLNPNAEVKDTASPMAPIRWWANGRSLGITALGEEAVDLLRANAHRLNRICAAEAGTPYQESWSSGQIGWRVGRTTSTYHVRRLVIRDRMLAAHGFDAKSRQVAPGPQLDAMIAARVRRDLQRQAAMCGLPELEDDPIMEVRGVEGVSGWTRDKAWYGIVVHGFELETDLDLRGPWAVGGLTLIGSGSLRKERRERASAA